VVSPYTLAVTAGRPDAPGSPLNVPVELAANYLAGADLVYAREDGTATWRALEAAVGALEGGRAVAFGSGMAAAAAVFALLPAGARVVLPTDCYQGVAALAADLDRRGVIRAERLDLADPGTHPRLAGADLVWVETPSNPLLKITDLAAVRRAAPHALLAVDSTFATPLGQQPLVLGADVVVHSATKFLGGHSDLLLGLAVTAAGARHERLLAQRRIAGGCPGALEAYLALRGLRTLPLRWDRAQQTAGELATRLAAHPQVVRVHYPGLVAHPGHQLARRQMRGFGAVLSFEVVGDAARADGVCAALSVIRPATSLGGVESTIERRGKYEGQQHLPAGLLRLAVGLEDVDDLWADLTAAL